MSDIYEITNGDVKIRIEGMRKMIRKLEKAGADALSRETEGCGREENPAPGNVYSSGASPASFSGADAIDWDWL